MKHTHKINFSITPPRSLERKDGVGFFSLRGKTDTLRFAQTSKSPSIFPYQMDTYLLHIIWLELTSRRALAAPSVTKIARQGTSLNGRWRQYLTRTLQTLQTLLGRPGLSYIGMASITPVSWEIFLAFIYSSTFYRHDPAGN
jgi:hypothetical protein